MIIVSSYSMNIFLFLAWTSDLRRIIFKGWCEIGCWRSWAVFLPFSAYLPFGSKTIWRSTRFGRFFSDPNRISFWSKTIPRSPQCESLLLSQVNYFGCDQVKFLNDLFEVVYTNWQTVWPTSGLSTWNAYAVPLSTARPSRSQFCSIFYCVIFCTTTSLSKPRSSFQRVLSLNKLIIMNGPDFYTTLVE